MSWWYDFPHTKEYDQDLGWLIHEYKRLGQDVEELSSRVKTLEELYESIPEEIKKATDEMEQRVNVAINQMLSRVDVLEQNVNQKLMEWQVQFDEMVAELNELYNRVLSYLADVKSEMRAWVEERLRKFMADYPSFIDPSDGKIEDLQTIIYHLYDDLGCGMPVVWFQGLQLTAQEYQDMNIPALYLQRYGRRIFRDFLEYRRCAYMFSPFTGEYVPISDVVIDLARLHQNAVTAGEFEDANIDVEVFTAKNVSAYDMGWTSVWFDEITAGGGNEREN